MRTNATTSENAGWRTHAAPDQSLRLWFTGALVLAYVASALLVGEVASAVLPNYVLIVLTVVFALEVLRFRLPVVFPVPLVWFAVFLCYVSLQMVWSPSPAAMLRALAVLFVLAVVIVNYDLASGNASLIEYAVYVSILCTFVYNRYSGEIPDDGRIGSTLANANAYAQVFLFGILFALRRALLDGLRHRLGRVEAICILAFFGISLYGTTYLTGSRKGILLVLLATAAFVLYWVWLQPIQRRVLITVAAVAVLAGLAYALYRTPQFARVMSISNYFSGQGRVDTSLTIRSSMIHDATDLWLQRPFIGWGLDQFRVVSGWRTYSHDNYLELLANEGILGFFMYLMIYVSTFVTLVRSLWRSRSAIVSAEVVWAIIVLAIMAAWDLAAVSYYSKVNWLMLSVVIAVSVRARLALASSVRATSSQE